MKAPHPDLTPATEVNPADLEDYNRDVDRAVEHNRDRERREEIRERSARLRNLADRLRDVECGCGRWFTSERGLKVHQGHTGCGL